MNQKSRQRTGPEVQTNDPVFICLYCRYSKYSNYSKCSIISISSIVNSIITVITVITEKDLSMKYLKIGIPDDLHPKFKGHCASINSSMQGRIVELIANDVNNGNTVYEVDTVTVEAVDTVDTVDMVDTVNTATVDTVDTVTVDTVEAVDTVNRSTDLKALIEGLNDKLESLGNRLEQVENRKKPKPDPNYKPEILEPGHVLNQNQLTKRLSEYKQSQGKASMGRGTLTNHRNKHKDNPSFHREWIQAHDPQGLFWDYNEEESVYVAAER